MNAASTIVTRPGATDTTKPAWLALVAHGGVPDIWQEDTTSESYHWNKEISDGFLARGANTRVRCQVGGGHCEADWEKLVPEFMNYLWME